MNTAPLSENCRQSLELRTHVCFGISPFNSYFSEERIRALALWGRKEFDAMHFFVPDVPSSYTLEALGYLPKASFGKDEIGERVFDELPRWKRGEQARVLRLFCEANGLVSIKFHTIRACFATQLLALGVPEDKVMKMGGWKDVETMRIYVRAAGILEHGATQGLRFGKDSKPFDPSSPYFNVDYRKATELSGAEGDADEDDTELCEVETEVVGGVAAPQQAGGNVVSFAAFRKERCQ